MHKLKQASAVLLSPENYLLNVVIFLTSTLGPITKFKNYYND